MQVYLYLNEVSHADTWVNGGKIPIKPASSYKSQARKGVMTPDENLIYKSEVELSKLSPFISIDDGAQIQGLTCIGNTIDGIPLPDIVDAQRYEEDGLILSFSQRLSLTVARRMAKVACVKVKDIFALKTVIDEQIGYPSKSGLCNYTYDHQRNHFLKSYKDSWQDEFRLFWPVMSEVWVTIPAGLAEYVVCVHAHK